MPPDIRAKVAMGSLVPAIVRLLAEAVIQLAEMLGIAGLLPNKKLSWLITAAVILIALISGALFRESKQ
jgi:hypothetical protein